MIQKILLNIQMTLMIFVKILKNTIQIKAKNIICIYEKKSNPIITELLIKGKKLR